MLEKMNNIPDDQKQYPPDNLVTRVWQELTRATKDRHHQWRTPVLASIGLDGYPQARTIVLRYADQSEWILDAYTDSRSPKCYELVKDNHAQLVFWNARSRWQLRVAVLASFHTEGDLVESAWAQMRQSKAAKDYLSNKVPGHPLTTNNINETASLNTNDHHYLAVLRFQIISIDWLALGKNTHFRAQIDPDGTVTSLTP